jgi:hypothetical protein
MHIQFKLFINYRAGAIRRLCFKISKAFYQFSVGSFEGLIQRLCYIPKYGMQIQQTHQSQEA